MIKTTLKKPITIYWISKRHLFTKYFFNLSVLTGVTYCVGPCSHVSGGRRSWTNKAATVVSALLSLVKLLSSKIVHINDKSVKFGMMITVTVTNNSGYGTSSSCYPKPRYAHVSKLTICKWAEDENYWKQTIFSESLVEYWLALSNYVLEIRLAWFIWQTTPLREFFFQSWLDILWVFGIPLSKLGLAWKMTLNVLIII